MRIDEKIEKHLMNERKPNKGDYNIKDMALALTGEIEVGIEEVVNDWLDHGELADMDTGEKSKMINLAHKEH